MGYNYRMTNISAAIANSQLIKLDKNTSLRRRNANFYSENISGCIIPIEKEDYKHVYHQYTIRVKNRDYVLKKLNDAGIGARVYYPKPLHLHPHFMSLGYTLGSFPESELAANEVLSLPVHPLLSEDEIKYIVKTLLSILN